MNGILLICGVDEAGRGPLAGPVCAAAVILDAANPIEGLADSKKLSEKQRDRLAPIIRERALAWSVAYAEVDEIDQLNILQATLLAMRRAVLALHYPAAPGAGGRPVLPANRHPQPGHRQGRQQSCRHFRGFHPGQDGARRTHAAAARTISAVRFRRTQGLSDCRAPCCAARTWRFCSASPQLQTRARSNEINSAKQLLR